MYGIWAAVFLLINTITDLKRKIIYVWVSIINFALAVMVRVILGELQIVNILFGTLVASLIWIICLITKGAIGEGEAIIIASLSAVLNIGYIINIIFSGLILCSVFSLIGIMSRKFHKKTQIPFIPFLFLAHMCSILIGG